MKHSWLRESVDKVLAEAPHMSDAHKRKLIEVVGLELVRAWARGKEEEHNTYVEISPAIEPPTVGMWKSLDAYVKNRYGEKG